MNPILARFTEPSTYASLAALLGLLSVSVDPGLLQIVTQLGVGASGALGIALKERSARAEAAQNVMPTAMRPPRPWLR